MIVANIKQKLLCLQQWRMTFVRREGNGAAHALSKVATESVMIKRWLNEQLECISEMLQWSILLHMF